MKRLILKALHAPDHFLRQLSVSANRLMFWLNDVDFGKNLRVWGHLYLRKARGSKISIGDNFEFTNGGGVNPLSRNLRGCIFTQFPDSSIIIGNNVGISSSCIRAKERIVIGNNVNIGAGCILIDTDAHNLDYRVRASKATVNKYGRKYEKDSFTAKSSPIVIEDNALIGAYCIILKGVTVGARSIIGAGSVVTKPVPPDCIAAGNPCKVIRKLG